jgi:AAA domain/Domain of unknown function (DUF3854)
MTQQNDDITNLSDRDLEVFARFGVCPSLLSAAHVRRVTDPEARKYGITGAGDMSGIIFPYFDLSSGHRITARLRRDHPDTNGDGKAERKYLAPFGDNRHLYFAPGSAELLSDVSVPAVIVESEKSVLALMAFAERTRSNLLPIGTGGCWGWRGKTGIEAGPNGEREELRGPLPDFELVTWLRRRAVILFDANARSNRKVQAAREALADTLAERGARVHFVDLPAVSTINGPDDFLGVRGDGELLALMGSARPYQVVPGVMASDVKPERVEWLWPGRIPLRKTTNFEGDPGEGKSTLALDIAARVTRGIEMPDGGPRIEPSGAVIVSLEDGAADTIIPRLIAAGADLSRVRIIQTITGADGFERTPTLPGDLSKIENAIRDVEALLLVLDPLVGMLSAETDSFRDQDIRRALAPINPMAERTGVAVIAIRHLNKSSNRNPKYRGGGSIGIIAGPRAAFTFAPNPDGDGTKVMAALKNNLAPEPASMKYRLVSYDLEIDGETFSTAKVEWLGESPHTARSILAEPETAEESNAILDAKSFLTKLLSGGPKAAKDVKQEAKTAGIAERTLIRARYIIGVTSNRVGGTGKDGYWEWELPNAPKDAIKDANHEELESLDQATETKDFKSTNSPKNAKNAKCMGDGILSDGILSDELEV